MRRCGPAAAALLAAGGCRAQVDPAHARNITAYHLNPQSAGAIPVNMDTGDARGDLYFYLGQFLLPVECVNISNSTPSKHGFNPAQFDCANQERVDPNLVVTAVDLEIDARTTQYAGCNLCNVTDPITHEPCKKGAYVCDCFDDGGGTCDPKLVGASNITENFVHHNATPTARCAQALSDACGRYVGKAGLEDACDNCTNRSTQVLRRAGCSDDDEYGFCSAWRHNHECTPESPDWACWRANLPRKTGGMWWSTLAGGECTPGGGPCSWNVLRTKTVKEKCLKDVLMTTVERASPGCFAGCGPRNATSSCWIGCFFDTMLGKAARDSEWVPLGGMPVEDIVKGWTNAFLPVEKGGCPEVLDMPVRNAALQPRMSAA